jgi:hypothetical protein
VRRIFQSTPVAQNVTAADGLTEALKLMSTEELDQVAFIQGSGGAVDIVANPQIEAHQVVGAKMTLIGMDATNTVQFDDGDGLALNGPAILGLRDVLELMWCGDRWIEIGRNN